MTTKRILGLCALACAIVFAAGYQLGKKDAPTKIEQVERIVEKRDLVTVTKEVTRPDGTKEKETTVTDKTKTEQKSETTVQNKLHDWRASGMVGIGVNAMPMYGVSIERRIISNVFVGAWGLTNATVGVSVGLEF